MRTELVEKSETAKYRVRSSPSEGLTRMREGGGGGGGGGGGAQICLQCCECFFALRIPLKNFL